MKGNRSKSLVFLRGLLNGGRSLVELRTPKYPFLLGFADQPGRWKELPSGKWWTDEDIKEYESLYPGDHPFAFWITSTEGNPCEEYFTKMLREVEQVQKEGKPGESVPYTVPFK